MTEKMVKVCETCGKEYYIHKYLYEKSKHCSRKCRVTKKIKICKQCGKEYYINKSRFEESNFCSRECNSKSQRVSFSGEKNPNYKGGHIIRCCDNCGKEYIILKSKISRSKFCSKKCVGEWRTKNLSGKNAKLWSRVLKICKHCGKEYYISRHRDITSNFCSYECVHESQKVTFAGKGNPRWKGGDGTFICSYCGKPYEMGMRHKNRTKFCSIDCKNLSMVVGGIWYGNVRNDDPLGYLLRQHIKMKKFVKSVLERDGYRDAFTGEICDDPDVHHIIWVATIIDKYNLKTIQQCLDCKELWDMKNAITLDRKNHNKIHGNIIFHPSK